MHTSSIAVNETEGPCASGMRIRPAKSCEQIARPTARGTAATGSALTHSRLTGSHKYFAYPTPADRPPRDAPIGPEFPGPRRRSTRRQVSKHTSAVLFPPRTGHRVVQKGKSESITSLRKTALLDRSSSGVKRSTTLRHGTIETNSTGSVCDRNHIEITDVSR